MFTVDERDRVRDRLIEVAKADPRIISGAMVGSLIGSSSGHWPMITKPGEPDENLMQLAG